MRRRAATLAVTLALAGGMMSSPVRAASVDDASDPRPDERGLPPVVVVPQTDVGSAQLFAVTVAQQRLYVGTLAGLAIYDGAQWELLEWPRALYAVHAAAGRVLAGGPDALVALQRLDDGRYALESLLDRLPDADRAIGDVRSIHALGDTFFVVTDRLLLRVHGAAVRVVERWRSDPSRRGFTSRNTLYVVSQAAVRGFSAEGTAVQDDLTAYDPDRGAVAFLIDHPAAGRVVGIEGRGLFAVDGGSWRPVATAAGDLARHGLTDARTLADGSVAVATVAHGLLRLTPALTFDGALSRAEGLPSAHVDSLAEDDEGGVWAVGPAELARIDLGASLTRVDARLGLEGTVNGVVRHGGRPHVLTSSGLYVLDATGPALRAHRVPGLSVRTWAAADLGSELLVATAEGVYDLRDGAATLVPGTARLWAYALATLPDDPSRLLVGARTGLSLLVRHGGAWRLEREIPGAPRYVRSIVARPGGVVYVGSTFDGVAKLYLGGGPAATICAGETTIRDIDGVIHVLSTDVPSLTRLDEARDTLAPLPRLVSVPPHTVRFAFDRAGGLWLSGRGAAMAPAGDGGLRPVLDRSLTVQSLVVEDDGVVWLGGASGLWRFAAGPGRAAAPRAPTLEHVLVNGDAVSTSGPNGGPVALPYGIERLRFEFSPNTFASTAVIDFRLEPLDDAWISPRRGQPAEYTSLPEGDYRLRMRTSTGSAQAESTWTFRVRPPWYRAPWMYAVEIVAGALVLLGVSHLRTRRLRRRSAALEHAVETQTAALQEANRRLAELAWRDELTGLSNRRHFEEAMAEEWARARRAGAPVALVLADIDHFKSLNDTLGHAAGDRALRAVAAVIEQCARRPGDVAARYGGDEFAVLLPASRAERVHALAEDIRQAVEALAIPHPGHPLGTVTVSVGVTAMVPPSDAEPTLVDAADRALYRAKAAGRNAVAA